MEGGGVRTHRTTPNIYLRQPPKLITIRARLHDFLERQVHPRVAVHEEAVEGFAAFELDEHGVADGGGEEAEGELCPHQYMCWRWFAPEGWWDVPLWWRPQGCEVTMRMICAIGLWEREGGEREPARGMAMRMMMSVGGLSWFAGGSSGQGLALRVWLHAFEEGERRFLMTKAGKISKLSKSFD